MVGGVHSAFVRRLDESDPTGESTKDLLLCMDPPRHTRVRRVGNRCFTPRALAGLEDELRERAQQIVWAAKREGTGDFVMDVARHLPLQAIAGLMGIPDDDRRSSSAGATRWRAARIRSTPSSDLSGVVEMFAYAHAAAEARLIDDLGDVTSRLVQPDANGQRLNSEEFAYFFMILAWPATRPPGRPSPTAWWHFCDTRTSGNDGGSSGRPRRSTRSCAGPRPRWCCSARPPRTSRWRPGGARGRAGGPVLRLRQLRRGGLRRPRTLRHRPHAEPPRHLRRRWIALLHRGQPLPPRAEGDVRRAGRRAGRRAVAGPAGACARRGSTASSTCRSTTEAPGDDAPRPPGWSPGSRHRPRPSRCRRSMSANRVPTRCGSTWRRSASTSTTSTPSAAGTAC